jgi:hypothetical protein
MIIFEAKKGHWGEHGWVRIKWHQWLTLWLNNYVTRIRRIKRVSR